MLATIQRSGRIVRYGAWGTLVVAVGIVTYEALKRGALAEALLIAVLAVIVMRLEVKPSYVAGAALVSAVAFPAAQLPVSGELAALPVATIPFLVWLTMRKGAPADPVSRIWAFLLGFWFCFCWSVGVVHARSGTVLTMVFILVVCVAAQQVRYVDTELAKAWFLRLGTVLAVFAVIEGLALHANPIYGSLYARATPPLVQVWSHYRVTTLMGHPLDNGVGFAVVGVLALDRVLTSPRSVLIPTVQLVLIATAEALTEARSGLIGFAVGAIVVLVVRRSSSGRLNTRRVVAGALLAIVFAAFGATVVGRFDSQEGAASLQDRAGLVTQTTQALRGRYVEGVGTGEAEASRGGPNGPVPTVPLESSYAEILAGTGVVGLILFGGFFVRCIARGLRRYETAGWAAALLTLLVAMGGFNAFEASHQLTIWLGALMVMTTAAGRADPSASD